LTFPSSFSFLDVSFAQRKITSKRQLLEKNQSAVFTTFSADSVNLFCIPIPLPPPPKKKKYIEKRKKSKFE